MATRGAAAAGVSGCSFACSVPALATLRPQHRPGGHGQGGHAAAGLRQSGIFGVPGIELRAPSGACAGRPRQALCPAVVCRSVPFVGALATYNLPLRTPAAPTVPEWLVSCIGDAAKHLDQAPFLQLLLPGRPKRLERHRVTHAVVQAPQLWHGIAEHLGRAAPEALVLVHPIAIGPPATAARALQAVRSGESRSAADVLTGIALGRRPDVDSDHHLRLAACARLLATGVARAEFAGRVGDCCDDDDAGDLHSAVHRAERELHMADQFGMSGQDVEYWGVVVQARARSDAEGCYVLKTVRSRAAASDCTCLHYSLIRVCKGEPLAAQLAASWLV